MVEEGMLAGNGEVSDLINNGGTVSPGQAVPEPAGVVLIE